MKNKKTWSKKITLLLGVSFSVVIASTILVGSTISPMNLKNTDIAQYSSSITNSTGKIFANDVNLQLTNPNNIIDSPNSSKTISKFSTRVATSSPLSGKYNNRSIVLKGDNYDKYYHSPNNWNNYASSQNWNSSTYQTVEEVFGNFNGELDPTWGGYQGGGRWSWNDSSLSNEFEEAMKSNLQEGGLNVIDTNNMYFPANIYHPSFFWETRNPIEKKSTTDILETSKMENNIIIDTIYKMGTPSHTKLSVYDRWYHPGGVEPGYPSRPCNGHQSVSNTDIPVSIELKGERTISFKLKVQYENGSVYEAGKNRINVLNEKNWQNFLVIENDPIYDDGSMYEDSLNAKPGFNLDWNYPLISAVKALNDMPSRIKELKLEINKVFDILTEEEIISIFGTHQKAIDFFNVILANTLKLSYNTKEIDKWIYLIQDEILPINSGVKLLIDSIKNGSNNEYPIFKYNSFYTNVLEVNEINNPTTDIDLTTFDSNLLIDLPMNIKNRLETNIDEYSQYHQIIVPLIASQNINAKINGINKTLYDASTQSFIEMKALPKPNDNYSSLSISDIYLTDEYGQFGETETQIMDLKALVDRSNEFYVSGLSGSNELTISPNFAQHNYLEVKNNSIETKYYHSYQKNQMIDGNLNIYNPINDNPNWNDGKQTRIVAHPDLVDTLVPLPNASNLYASQLAFDGSSYMRDFTRGSTLQAFFGPEIYEDITQFSNYLDEATLGVITQSTLERLIFKPTTLNNIPGWIYLTPSEMKKRYIGTIDTPSAWEIANGRVIRDAEDDGGVAWNIFTNFFLHSDIKKTRFVDLFPNDYTGRIYSIQFALPSLSWDSITFNRFKFYDAGEIWGRDQDTNDWILQYKYFVSTVEITKKKYETISNLDINGEYLLNKNEDLIDIDEESDANGLISLNNDQFDTMINNWWERNKNLFILNESFYPENVFRNIQIDFVEKPVDNPFFPTYKDILITYPDNVLSLSQYNEDGSRYELPFEMEDIYGLIEMMDFNINKTANEIINNNFFDGDNIDDLISFDVPTRTVKINTKLLSFVNGYQLSSFDIGSSNSAEHNRIDFDWKDPEFLSIGFNQEAKTTFSYQDFENKINSWNKAQDMTLFLNEDFVNDWKEASQIAYGTWLSYEWTLDQENNLAIFYVRGIENPNISQKWKLDIDYTYCFNIREFDKSKVNYGYSQIYDRNMNWNELVDHLRDKYYVAKLFGDNFKEYESMIQTITILSEDESTKFIRLEFKLNPNLNIKTYDATDSLILDIANIQSYIKSSIKEANLSTVDKSILSEFYSQPKNEKENYLNNLSLNEKMQFLVFDEELIKKQNEIKNINFIYTEDEKLMINIDFIDPNIVLSKNALRTTEMNDVDNQLRDLLGITYKNKTLPWAIAGGVSAFLLILGMATILIYRRNKQKKAFGYGNKSQESDNSDLDPNEIQ